MIRIICLSILFLVTSQQTSAKTWQQAIDDVFALAESYKAAAEEISGEQISHFLGTVHSTTHFNMHQCAILGRRLGFPEHISHLEPEQPSLKSDPQSLADNYASLTNWIYAAEWFAGVSQHERAKRWNNECVGNLGISQNLWVEVPAAVFYRVERSSLFVYGDVIEGFARRIEEALVSHPEVDIVYIGSGGGNVTEALKAGYLVRRLGLSTQLSGECVSACSIFFLSGINRRIMRPYPRLGFHKVSIHGKAVNNNDPIYDVIWKYAEEMGVNAKFFIAAMQNWEPNEMGYLTPDQACISGIVTWYQGVVTSKC